MHCGFTVINWRASHEFIPLFLINTLLLGIVSSFVQTGNEDSLYYSTKLSACIISGVLFDYLPTKAYLLSLYLLGFLGGFFHYLPIVWITTAQEVLTLAYVSEVLSDNCKFIGLAEIVGLQVVSKALGSILHWLASEYFSLSIFAPATAIVLFIVNLAVFRETPKTSRPLFSPDNEETVFPRVFGVVICLLVLYTSGSHFILFPTLVQSSFMTPVLIYTFKVFIVPLIFFCVLSVLRYKKISQVLIFFLLAGVGAWLFFLWKHTELLGVFGVIATSVYCKCAGLVLLSRVLGPYYNGKLFGVGLGSQYIFGTFFLSEWWTVFLIGISASIISVVCLAPGLKYCEYHRDYVIGRVSPDMPKNKKMNFKIKLKRASVLDT